MKNPRSGWDWEGYFTLANSTFGLGETETAAGLASWFIDKPDHHENVDWFVEAMKSCALAILGRDAEALDMLERVKRSPRLMPAYFLEDSLCFQQLIDEQRYQAVVDHFEGRRAELRKRLPATLTAFSVRP